MINYSHISLWIAAIILAAFIIGPLVSGYTELKHALSVTDLDGASLKFQAINTISTAITALAIIGTVIVAHIAYNVTSRTARIQKTIDFISAQVNDKDLIEMMAKSRAIKRRFSYAKQEINYENVLNHQEILQNTLKENGILAPEKSGIADQIYNLINYYETWSVGIDNGALDEDILKDWWKTTYVRDWNIYKPFIKGHRREQNHPKAFRKFQMLAEKWESESV